MTEKLYNSLVTPVGVADMTLNGAINNSVTSVVVHAIPGNVPSGNFRIRIDDEIMTVTGISSLTLTVTRASEDATQLPAASHTDGANIYIVPTSGGVAQYVTEHRTAIKRIVRQAGGDYTTSSSTFVDIDATNLTLDLTLAINDIVEISLTGQRLYDGGNAGYYDVRVIQPDTTSVRCNNSSDHGAVGYFTARDGVSLTVYFTATQAGTHTFRPVFLSASGTETFCNSATGGANQTGIAFAVKNFGPSA